jgi:hypothetical protein
METNQENKELILEDPVSKETLEQLIELEEARSVLGRQLLELESRRVQVLSADKRTREQIHRMLDSISVNRGLSPNTPISVDPVTGKVELVE